MILVLLGTQNKGFERLLKEISKNIKNKKIKDNVIVQKGCTNYNDNDMETFDYLPKEQLLNYIKNADLIITHGGVGTIIECLNFNKKIIVAPRLKKFKEHTNNHQLQIVKEFSNKGYVIPLYNMNELVDKIKDSKNFKPKKYISNQNNFANKIKNYIDNL